MRRPGPLRICLLLLCLSAPALALISTRQEVAIGRRAAAKYERRYGIVRNRAMEERVNRIGQALVAHCGRRDIRYSFKVSNQKGFNALAFPGGFIFATRELVQTLPDPELAFVLGHEITHVVKRHAVKQLQQNLYTKLGTIAVLEGVTGGRVGRAPATLANLADMVASNQYSQADEAQADAGGVLLMARAGYDPVYAVAALRTLASKTGSTPGFLNTLVGDHPLPRDRIAAAELEVPTIPFQPRPPARLEAHRPSGAPRRPAIDRIWQKNLRETVALAGTGLKPSAHLMHLARRLATSPQRDGSERGRVRLLVIPIPAPASSVQGESILLGTRLPELLRRRRFSRYGLGVGRLPDGTRQIVMTLE